MPVLWKTIIDYPNYKISNTGEVLSFESSKYPNGKSIKYKLNDKGYYRVTLINNKKRGYFFIHRLVAIHFIDNPENKEFVNHIDGIKTNNNSTNLEWCNRFENMQHAVKIGLMKLGEEHGRAKLTEENVLYIRSEIKKGRSAKSVSLEFPVHYDIILKIKNRVIWKQI